MIAQYIKKNGYWYCSHCLMRVQGEFQPFCHFCEATMSNVEDVLIQEYKDLISSQNYDIMNYKEERKENLNERTVL